MVRSTFVQPELPLQVLGILCSLFSSISLYSPTFTIYTQVLG